MDAKLRTNLGIRSDVERFKSNRKAEELVASPRKFHYPRRLSPTADIFTYGLTSLARGAGGWGEQVRLASGLAEDLWGPIITNPCWLGATRPIHNTGKIRAISNARLIQDYSISSLIGPQHFNYYIHLFAMNSMKVPFSDLSP